MSLIISTITDRFFEKINKNPAFLTCPNGNILIYEVIKNINLKNIKNIYIVINKKDIINHFNEEDIKEMLKLENKHIKIMLIDEVTKKHPETIYKCIKEYNIKGAIFIKDFKNVINCCPSPGNYIYYLNYKNYDNISKLYNKSSIILDNLKKITNISEKNIISNNICIGLYSFQSTEQFILNYEKILKIRNICDIINISHVIYSSIINNEIFSGIEIKKYIELTYYDDWLSFCNKYKTLFVDIDGTLVLNSGEYSKKKWGETEYLKKNVDFLNKLYNTGTIQIILTTARKSKCKDKTFEQLKKYNIPYDNILFDLYHGKRYLINDFSNTNTYPSAISINLSRDNDDLEKYFTY
jgi:hypothetical protein